MHWSARGLVASAAMAIAMAMAMPACAPEPPPPGAPVAPGPAPAPPSPASPAASPATAAPSDASSPEAAWRSLLAAMQARDEAGIARLTTPSGRASLEAGVHGEARLDVFERWGKGWAAWEIRWGARTADRAEAKLGPEVKEHHLVFEFSGGAWKLAQWLPGE